MQPAGNTPYDADTAWSREGLVRSQELLESLPAHFTTFLSLEVDEIARDAHFRFIKKHGVGSQTWRAIGKNTADAPVSPTVRVPSGNQPPDFWFGLQQKFRALADEEAKLAPQNTKDRWLRASVDYNPPSTRGQWHLSLGVNEYLRERFDVEGTRAGIALGAADPNESLMVWLDHLFAYLLETKSRLLLAASEQGGMIGRVIEASALYCARLEKLPLMRQGKAQPAPPDEKAAGDPVKDNARTQSDLAGANCESARREAVIKRFKALTNTTSCLSSTRLCTSRLATAQSIGGSTNAFSSLERVEERFLLSPSCRLKRRGRASSELDKSKFRFCRFLL